MYSRYCSTYGTFRLSRERAPSNESQQDNYVRVERRTAHSRSSKMTNGERRYPFVSEPTGMQQHTAAYVRTVIFNSSVSALPVMLYLARLRIISVRTGPVYQYQSSCVGSCQRSEYQIPLPNATYLVPRLWYQISY